MSRVERAGWWVLAVFGALAFVAGGALACTSRKPLSFAALGFAGLVLAAVSAWAVMPERPPGAAGGDR